MNLRSGMRLGPYEVVAPIGAGGMGEVYRGRDTRLDRQVAIKVLPAEFASDAKFKTRFEREAKVIAALNHPHICTLHDVGSENGIDYLVMELCDGKSLAQRLESGPLPIDQVLDYGTQIAGALERAHRKGIIHRDLKPSNVMLTKTGVKLLDFGLAKQQSAAAHDPLSRTSTVDRPVTADTGLAGTLQYMAPETLTSGQVDLRSDIYALGLVLYEMIGSRPAFSADSRAKLVAAILEREPAPLPAGIDRHLEHIVSRCLAKDPDQRWQSAADIAAELQWVRSRTAAVAAVPGRRPAILFPVVAALLVAAVTILIVQWLQRPAPPKVERRLSSVVIPEAPLVVRGHPPLAISPDGATLAYAAGDPPQLFLKSLRDGQTKMLPETEAADQPFFSPDGKWLGFTQGRHMKRIEIATGETMTISEKGQFGHPIWGEDDTIVCGRDGTLYQIPASGGEPRMLLEPPPGQSYAAPSFLPGGRKLLFHAGRHRQPNERGIMILDLPTRQVSLLYTGGSQPHYVRGHLLLVRTDHPNSTRASIHSLELDAVTGRVSGPAITLVSDVRAYPLGQRGRAYYAAGSDGNIYYVPEDRAAEERELLWLDFQGRPQPATARLHAFRYASLSPDGTRVAFDDRFNLWVGDLLRDTFVLVTAHERAAVSHAAWSPDGSTIAYLHWPTAAEKDDPAIAFAYADGSGAPSRRFEFGFLTIPSSWSFDGRSIAFDTGIAGAGERAGIWAVDVESGESRHLMQGLGFTPSFSPDGRWVAYVGKGPHNEDLVQVQPFPGPGQRHTLFTASPCRSRGGCSGIPRWSRDGKRLFFQDNRKVMVVAVDTSREEFRAGPAKVLFEADFDFGRLNLSPDGERFLVTRLKREPRWDHINILSGWWND